MLINYKVVGVAGWNALLNDSAAGNPACTVQKFQPQFKDVVQPVTGYQAPSQALLPMQNTIVTLSLEGNMTYADAQTALAAVRTLRAALKGNQVHLQVIQGIETQYYPNGALTDMKPSVVGASVEHSFSFETQDVTATAPTT